LMPMRNSVGPESLLPEVSETFNWLANPSEHLVNTPVTSSSPVIARIWGGARLVIMKFFDPLLPE
jgi:hypothetical protein